MSQSTPKTKLKAYRDIQDENLDSTLRLQVAAVLADDSLTTHEIGQAFSDRSLNAIRPRVNELIRMDCVRREGTRENPSGHEAAVHHLTETGRAYLRGDVDPNPDPPLSELKDDVVQAARAVVKDGQDRLILDTAIDRLDAAQAQLEADT